MAPGLTQHVANEHQRPTCKADKPNRHLCADCLENVVSSSLWESTACHKGSFTIVSLRIYWKYAEVQHNTQQTRIYSSVCPMYFRFILLTVRSV
jgi:hypothetical protein